MDNILHIRAGRIVVSDIMKWYFILCNYTLADIRCNIICILLSFTVYQCHISEASIETLPLHPGVRRFCVFSLAFSNNGEEILGGANDRCLYIYSLYCQRRFERVCKIIIQCRSALPSCTDVHSYIMSIFIVHRSWRRRKLCCLCRQ